MKENILEFKQITSNDVAKVGGKNASLGEMFQNLSDKGVKVPDGFAVTANAYRKFIKENFLIKPLQETMKKLDRENFSNLHDVGTEARNLMAQGEFPYDIQVDILSAYHILEEQIGKDCSVAVRSSATAEDLPEASFAGQQESFLNIKGADEILQACLDCYVSLFTDRAIKYREDMGFDHLDIADESNRTNSSYSNQHY